MLGTAQSGMGDLRFVEFLADTALVREARQLAEAGLEEDPRLQDAPGLRALVDDAGRVEVS